MRVGENFFIFYHQCHQRNGAVTKVGRSRRDRRDFSHGPCHRHSNRVRIEHGFCTEIHKIILCPPLDLIL
jgi:hypothetical protein